MSEYTGRGATAARTTIDGDLVCVVLEDALSKGERSLVRHGQSDLVLGIRRAYQAGMQRDLVAGIEEILQRKVVAFLSDNHIDPDVVIEAFVLAPPNPDAAAARQRSTPAR